MKDRCFCFENAMIFFGNNCFPSSKNYSCISLFLFETFASFVAYGFIYEDHCFPRCRRSQNNSLVSVSWKIAALLLWKIAGSLLFWFSENSLCFSFFFFEKSLLFHFFFKTRCLLFSQTHSFSVDHNYALLAFVKVEVME